MTIINFTKSANSVSDFEAEVYVANCLQKIDQNVEAIEICNMLIIQMLRAALINSFLKYKVTWQFEGTPIHMDWDMRSKDLWNNPVTGLEEEALMSLMENSPSRLRAFAPEDTLSQFPGN